MTNKITWKNEKRKVKDLIPFKGNPRKAGEKEIKDLDKSLDRFNLATPLVINTDGEVIGGNFRLSRQKEKGVEEVDVRVPNRTLTRKESEELNLRLNKNAGLWDKDILANFGEELLKDVGWSSDELDDMFELDVKEDDFNVEKEYEKIKDPTTKLGEVYQLGKHRLMCGNSTKEDDAKKLMNGKTADMVFTDPPYNVDYKGTKFDKIKGDKQDEESFIKFSEDFIARMSESVKEGGVFYICSGYSSFPTFLYALRVNGFKFSTPIVWVKNNTSLGWGDYRHKNEMVIKSKNPKTKKKKAQPILYGWKDGRHYFIESRFESDVWEIKRRASNTMVHPTQKPIEIVSRAIRNSSKRDNIVLDLFGGSGSTLISAEQEGRTSYLMELDPKYCDVIIKRWEKFTSETAVKL